MMGARFPAGLIGLKVQGRLETWALIAAGVVTAVYVVTSLALPFGWDQGMMASAGSAFVHGGLPYVDSWEVKGPMALAPYALAETLFGPTMWGIRIFDVILCGFASLILYRAIRTQANEAIGAWAAFAFYYWIASGGWFTTAAPESWTAALCIIAIAPLLSSAKATSDWRYALSGVLIGCVGLIKPMYLVVGLAPLLSIALTQGVARWRRVGSAFVLGVGAAAPIALVGAYYAARGGFSHLIEVFIFYSLSTYTQVSTNTTAIDGFSAFFSRPTVALLVPFIVLGAWTLRDRPKVLWPSLGWLAAMVLSVVLQGKYYVYQWVPCYPPMILLAAVGVFTLTRGDANGRAPALFTLGAALVFAGQVCALPMHDAAKAIYYLALKRSPDTYYASFNFAAGDSGKVYNAANEWAAARYISAHTDPNEGVFVWGNDATVRYLADRPNPTRFTYEMPLSLQGPLLASYRAEAIEDLRAHPPAYIVVGVNWWAPDTKQQSLAKFPEMAELVNRNYSLEESFGTLDLYRRHAPR